MLGAELILMAFIMNGPSIPFPKDWMDIYPIASECGPNPIDTTIRPASTSTPKEPIPIDRCNQEDFS
jgi:hypothetical protein